MNAGKKIPGLDRYEGETATDENLRKMRRAQVEQLGALCGPERGWYKRNDGSAYMRTGWYLAHVWTPSGGTGWRGRVDTMIAPYDEQRTRHAETYVIQAEGGFGRTHEFATADEAKAYCDQAIARGCT